MCFVTFVFTRTSIDTAIVLCRVIVFLMVLMIFVVFMWVINIVCMLLCFSIRCKNEIE